MDFLNNNTIEALGYIGIAGFFFLAMVIVIIPSELSMAFIGYTAATSALFLTPSIVAATIGATVGMAAVYALGRFIPTRIIYSLIDRYGIYLRVNRRDIERSEDWLRRYSTRVSFIGQLIPGVRFAVGIVAGMERLPFWRFFGYTAAGVLTWVTVFACLGYFFSEGYELVLEYYEAFFSFLGVLALLTVLFLWYRRPPR